MNELFNFENKSFDIIKMNKINEFIKQHKLGGSKPFSFLPMVDDLPM